MSTINFERFSSNCIDACAQHNIKVPHGTFIFSDLAKRDVENGNWDKCASELAKNIEVLLKPILNEGHAFYFSPYVRKVNLPDGRSINAAIINQQSKDWYGSDHFVSTCDFLIPSKLGLLRDCKTYLDLGGHQLIWACYYAGTGPEAKVISFEPSILNVLIGLFNCLINDVIEKVNVVPFAVKISGNESFEENDKMLVDFLKVPLKSVLLSAYISSNYDFTKTDIEGYEYEMLIDPLYVQLVKNAKFSHFELHLGHLIKRGVNRDDCIKALKRAGINGNELYTGEDMYSFLKNCDENGFFAFCFQSNQI
jgi:hypothetical protein